MMPKRAAPFFFLLALLLLSSLITQAASRPHPADPTKEEHEVLVSGDEADFDETMGGDCGGSAADQEEECLMRRTLVAHTDYIYTQHKKP